MQYTDSTGYAYILGIHILYIINMIYNTYIRKMFIISFSLNQIFFFMFKVLHVMFSQNIQLPPMASQYVLLKLYQIPLEFTMSSHHSDHTEIPDQILNDFTSQFHFCPDKKYLFGYLILTFPLLVGYSIFLSENLYLILSLNLYH